MTVSLIQKICSPGGNALWARCETTNECRFFLESVIYHILKLGRPVTTTKKASLSSTIMMALYFWFKYISKAFEQFPKSEAEAWQAVMTTSVSTCNYRRRILWIRGWLQYVIHCVCIFCNCIAMNRRWEMTYRKIRWKVLCSACPNILLTILQYMTTM